MESQDQCPRCGGKGVVHGSMFHRAGFRPEGIKFLTLSFQLPEVHVPNSVNACIDCGLYWTEIDREKLRQKLRDLGKDEIKKRLGIEDEPG